MSELTRLKFQRGQLKAKITRLKTFYESINWQEIEDNDVIVSELEIRLEKVFPVVDEFNVLQTEIEILTNTEFEENERDEFEGLYYKLVANIKKSISTVTISNTSPNRNNSGFSSSFTNEGQIKLPTIKLPTFNGHYDRWLEFRDAFNALIHDNKTITNIQRFYYLRSSLEGDACKIIESIQVSDINYNIAWQLLKDRFENKRLIVYNHVKALFDLPVVQREAHIALRNLFDNVTKHLRSLEALGQPVSQWDTLIIHLVTTKMDNITRREWESFNLKGELPQLSDINQFLKQRCELLEKLQCNQSDNYNKVQSNNYQNKNRFKNQCNAYVNTSNNKLACYYCKREHTIYNCNAFLKHPPAMRTSEAKRLKLCINCLRPGHPTLDCQVSNCRTCGRKHNSLLHIETKPSVNNNTEASISQSQSESIQVNVTETQPSQSTIVGHAVKSNDVLPSHVLLSTAVIRVPDSNGKFHNCRALLDSGSQSNFITERFCKRINAPMKTANYSITGVGQILSTVNYTSDIQIFSNSNAFHTILPCLVLPRITENLPTIPFNKIHLKLPENIQLADPTFNQPGEIDLLLGANIFWELLCVGQFKLDNTQLLLQKTKLGWVVSGTFQTLSYSQPKINLISNFSREANNIDNNLTKFWEIEEVPFKSKLSNEDQLVETHFLNTFRRDIDGKFIVSMPFKCNTNQSLGQSRHLTMQRFLSHEKKLLKFPDIYEEYKGFMSEYEQLGHMYALQETESELKCNNNNFYLPHHSVIKDSTTTRLRVVFDGSMKTDNGVSLNDIQYSGFTVQDDLFSIILRFRKYNYVMTADISKMYRMIKLDPDQRKFQRIFWRDNPSENIKCFELSTVTYGMTSAPYLATRCLCQLALEHEQIYPLASTTIKHDFYVDDLLTGSNSMSELVTLQRQISKILSEAGFQLRKWLSNHPKFSMLFEVDEKLTYSFLQLGNNENNKTLGVLWNASQDKIQYAISIPVKVTTKRTILSTISQIFDPLGLLGPIIIVAKILLQKLWQEKISWDESISQGLQTIWNQFTNDLVAVNNIAIPRHVILKDYQSIELHGFADSSIHAYGCCIYIRCVSSSGKFCCKLLCAKSRVAPIKQITLPRLELCSAVLLAQLVEKVKIAIKLHFDKYYYYSDSTITLSWIKASPTRWKTFVANRVSEVQRLTDISNWYHVKSQENPADLISRGVSASDLLKSNLWWSGPKFLNSSGELNLENNNEYALDVIPEEKTFSCVVTAIKPFELFNTYSSFRKLQRVFTYCLRFINNTRKNNLSKCQGPLSTNELQSALYKLVKLAQQESFPQDFKLLSRNVSMNKRSKLLSLNPILDENKLIRVGGRIQNSSSPYDKRHPIILPTKHPITSLILKQEHIRLLHCGPTMLLSSIRERFWPISGRNLCKRVVRECIKCFRCNPTSEEYLMGNLPDYRVKQNFPFENTGTDFAGPFQIRDRNTRGFKLVKAYICLFVCMATKAIHIEIVSDLTTECFLACFKRFISRRGRPKNIFSDNGKTYVGASRKLTELSKFFNCKANELSEMLTIDNINWHFIPARAPNFGGIWEAGIKMIKYHLKRVLANAHLTFEGLSTVLVQIESILNSRPLCPLSTNPDQLNPLTPAHFLVGRSLTTLPEHDLINTPENRLKYFQRLQQLVQHFWVRWHKEYLSELQTRVRWKSRSGDYIKVGVIVLIKEDNVPPCSWHMGVITQVHPGQDGVIRVVSVKIKGSEVKRAVNKLCIFPFETELKNTISI